MTEWCFYCFYIPCGQETDYLYVGFNDMPTTKTLMRLQKYLKSERYRPASTPETYKLWNYKIPSISWTDLRFHLKCRSTSIADPELPFIDEDKAIDLIAAPF